MKTKLINFTLLYALGCVCGYFIKMPKPPVEEEILKYEARLAEDVADIAYCERILKRLETDERN